MLCTGSIYITVRVDVLPVFTPNEYFWKHHWLEGKEEKWEAYARAVRQIMAQHGGFKLSDLTMEDKFKYKAAIKEAYKKNKTA